MATGTVMYGQEELNVTSSKPDLEASPRADSRLRLLLQLLHVARGELIHERIKTTHPKSI
jgi:hypothetical protein